MKYIVIGGAGAIGTNLVNMLVALGEETLVLDNLSSGSLDHVNENVVFKYCDIRDKEKLKDIIIEFSPNYILNLAAHFANQNSVDYIYEDINTNIIGIINILECCKNLQNFKKYVYASSSCVYGSQELMNEKDNVEPYETPYAINKYVGELYSKYYTEQFNIPITNVRIFNTYGPGEFPGKYRNVIPNFINNALEGKPLVITGNGEEIRDFTFVEDTCRTLLSACHSKYSSAEIFNSGTGSRTKIKELATKIIEISGSNSIIQYSQRREWDDVSIRVSDISKSKEYLGYLPTVQLEEGLTRTIEWHQKECQK
jgi:nucleoside-diphosphate-sugar epimerase